MNDTQIILAEIEELKNLVNQLQEELSISKVTYYENLPPNAAVGKDYVAYRFNCKEESVVRGKFDTDKIPRLRNKPIAFIKRNVDAVWHELTKSPALKAAEIIAKANNSKKRSKG